MKIDLPSLKKIAKAVPDLTIAHLVAVLTSVVEVERTETERERIANKRQQPATTANNDQQTPTHEEQDKQLYRDFKAVCGRSCGGFVTDLKKANHFDLAKVRAVLDVAKTKADPAAYVAAECKRQANGTGTSTVAAAFDRLSADAEIQPGSGDGPLLDLTATSDRTR